MSVASGADSEVHDVEDDAKAANNDEQYSNDSRLAMTIRAHNGSGLVWLNDVLRLNLDTSARQHGLLLLLGLHSDVYTHVYTRLHSLSDCPSYNNIYIPYITSAKAVNS